MSKTSVKVDTTSERNPSTRDAEKRSRQFTAVLLAALVAVPAFCYVLRTIVLFKPGLLWLIIWLDLAVFGAVLPLVAVGVGFKVSKRIPFVVGHVALTIHFFAAATSLWVSVGWDRPGTGRWWTRAWAAVLDVVTVPGWFLVLYLFGSLAVAGSWLLYRIDAFRAATSKDGKDGSGLAELLGFPVGANVRQSSIDSDEYAITATIDHPTVPADNVARALPALVEKAGAVRGRSTMIPDARGGSSTVRIVMQDPMKDWRIWPGLSHPGGTFAHPFRTAYYSTGEAQWYSFARTPEPDEHPVSHLAPDFRSPNDAHLGRQGATRSGKSGDIAVEISETLSRRDAIACFVNLAKLRQDSGWALDFASLLADNPPRARLIFDGLRKVGEFRSDVMGDLRYEGRHRTWTPLTYDELEFPAIYVQVDEGDLALSGKDVTWLSTKGLSLGIYLSVSISRAVTDGMASTLRSAIPVWKAFGAGQSYDGGFALTENTIKAGASPADFGTRFPGAHYLDQAGGVDETKYPLDARSFKTRRDFGDLRAAVEAARATFTPATLTPEEISAFGTEAWEFCQPGAVLIGSSGSDDGDEKPQATERIVVQQKKEVTPVPQVAERFESGDPELDELMNRPRPDFAAIGRELGMDVPPIGEPMPDLSDPNQPGGDLEDVKPQVSGPEVVAEFDAALIRMMDRGVREFANKDVIEEMQVSATPTWVSRRFKQICDEGALITPPGLAIERLEGRKNGRFLLTRLSPPPA